MAEREILKRLEAHLWFSSFDEYAKREMELRELLCDLHGDGSVIVFFKKTPEYIETGSSYNSQDETQVDKLINFMGIDNIDFVIRIAQDANRETGCLRGRQRQDE